MSKKYLCGLISAALLMASLFAHAETVTATIYKEANKFTGYTRFFTNPQDADLDGGSFLTSRYVLVSFIALNPAISTETPFAISFTTRTPDWIFISRGESLHLLLDGQERIAVSGDGSLSNRDVESGGTLVENAKYLLSAEQMRKIGAAKVVEFQLTGEKQRITGKLGRLTIEEAKLFGEKGEELVGLKAPTPVAISQEPVKLGVQFVPVDEKVRNAISYPNQSGAFVLTVAQGSVASSAGLMQGDVITSFGEKKIVTIADLQQSVAETKRGQAVKISVWRQGSVQALNAQF